MPIVVALAACSKEPTTSTATSAAARETMTGVVRVAITEGQRGKVFRGVMLERDDGSKWVLTYSADTLWRAFDGRRVVVTGERYVPENQALVSPHFRAVSWKVEKPGSDDALESVGEERVLTGTFTETTYPEGTKLAGEHATTFDAAGTSYQLDAVPSGVALAKSVTIKAREVELSRFSAHVGGPTLHVVEVVR